MKIIINLLLVTSFPVLVIGQDLPSTYPPKGKQDSYFFHIVSTDSTGYPSVYPNKRARDSIDSEHEDHYKVAHLIEEHTLERQDTGFLQPITREKQNPRRKWPLRTWNVVLTNGDTIRIEPTEVSSRPAHFMFEYYYPERELILFRLLIGKQIEFALISREDGKVREAFGPPVFSPSGKWLATFHNDGLAGWSPNGLQLFKITGDSIERVIHYKMGRREPGPTGLRWIDDSTFQIEMREHYPVQGGTTTNYEHYRFEIHETVH